MRKREVMVGKRDKRIERGRETERERESEGRKEKINGMCLNCCCKMKDKK